MSAGIRARHAYAETTMEELYQERGRSLVGRVIKTVPYGEWPGGNARITEIRPDADEKEIICEVVGLSGKIKGWSIGVFCNEPVRLVR